MGYKVYRCSIETPSNKDEEIAHAERLLPITPICIADLDGPKTDPQPEMVGAWWTPTGFVAHLMGFPYKYACSPGKFTVSVWPVTMPINDANSPEHICKDTWRASHSIDGNVWQYSNSGAAPLLQVISASGRYTAMVFESNELGSFDPLSLHLQLLEFVQSPPEVRCKELEVPCFIDLEKVYSLGLDEHYGVIYLSDCRGTLFALPYA